MAMGPPATAEGNMNAQILDALKVIVHDRGLRQHLQEHDPKALEQADRALDSMKVRPEILTGTSAVVVRTAVINAAARAADRLGVMGDLDRAALVQIANAMEALHEMGQAGRASGNQRRWMAIEHLRHSIGLLKDADRESK